MIFSLLRKTVTLAFCIGWLASVAPAQAKKTLTVYTYDSFALDWGPGPEIKKSFEKRCHCRLVWVTVQDGVALLNRLRLEGDRSRADVVLGLDLNLLSQARATGLFAPHGVGLNDLTLPLPWDDEIFLPYDYAHFAVVYDTQTIANPPTSLKQLIEDQNGPEIILQDPRTSTPGLGFLLWIKAVYGERAKDAWARLRPRILTVTPGWSEAYGLFTAGEAPMVFSYVTSPAYHMTVEDSDRYAAAVFEEGHYLQVEVAAQLISAREPALAQAFLHFIATPGFQDHIPTRNWMYPAARTSQPLPEAFSKIVRPRTTLLIPSSKIAQKRQEWTDEWLNAMSGPTRQ